MKTKTGVLPILSLVLRYIATCICIGIGIFIVTGNTNSMVGVTMAFVCAIMICPLLDNIMSLMHRRYDTSLKALLVIITVIVDILFSKNVNWFWINTGIIVVLFVLFGFLSNMSKTKSKPVAEENEVEEIEKAKPLVKKLSVFEEEQPKQPRKIVYPNTANQCYEYIINHGYGQGFGDVVILDSMELILAALTKNEKILFCFMGRHQYVSELDNQGIYGYALTNKRILFARKNSDGQHIQALALPKMESVVLKKGLIDSIMTIKSTNTTITIGMDNDSCRKVAARIYRFIEEVQRLKREHQASS